MCGIFGVFFSFDSGFPAQTIADTTKQLAILSESRGKDSAGFSFVSPSNKHLEVLKGDFRIRHLVKSKEFESALQTTLESYKSGKSNFEVFGHARLVTNGSQLQPENNQPLIKNGNLLIHNGIIVNADDLWKSNQDIDREFRIDSEIILSLLEKHLSLNMDDVGMAISHALNSLKGTYTIMGFFPKIQKYVLATNNGSLYYLYRDRDFLVFGSERLYLNKVKSLLHKSGSKIGNLEIGQVLPGTALIVDALAVKVTSVSLEGDHGNKFWTEISDGFKLSLKIFKDPKVQKEVVVEPDFHIPNYRDKSLTGLLENNVKSISKLKRCTRCILPETFPFIEFDSLGVCNYCRHHRPIQKHAGNLSDLVTLIRSHKPKIGKYDCLVPFSGGRDSTYTLHILKKELGLNPLAFTYDWGMVTDLARRNSARVCGKLGVENIIVAADIHRKRRYIKQNVLAWLNNPHLGMIPLFMAGDKFFFYYANRLLNQNDLKYSVWGSNFYENTNFKLGFAGIPPRFEKKRIDELSFSQKLKLATFFGLRFIENPGYINASIMESIGSFITRYVTPDQGFVQFFNYLDWDEREIESLILKEYEWELATDTQSTWRIGDGTAGFYNYIYHTVAGFSEVDTFRSNQIRDGKLDREKALSIVEKENYPRYDNIKWYLEVIGVDFASTIKRINQIPKLYDL